MPQKRVQFERWAVRCLTQGQTQNKSVISIMQHSAIRVIMPERKSGNFKNFNKNSTQR